MPSFRFLQQHFDDGLGILYIFGDHKDLLRPLVIFIAVLVEDSQVGLVKKLVFLMEKFDIACALLLPHR